MLVNIPRSATLKVAVDARTLAGGHLRGMGKYLIEAINHVDAAHDVEWDLFADRPDAPFLRPTVRRANLHLFEWKGYRFRSWEQLALPHMTRLAGSHVLHCPASTMPWWQPVPAVVTIHDAFAWTHDEPGWPRGFYMDRVLPAAFRRCAAVITVSATSARDIASCWPALADKIHVIPHGIGAHYRVDTIPPVPRSLEDRGIRRPYLLYVGGTVPRKRLDWAIRILDRLQRPAVRLVVCGVEQSAHDQVIKAIPPEMRPRVCIAPAIEESEMPSVYSHAVAVLYPTLFEGFGLPALEGQAVGTPVLFSNVGSLGELQGPGAVTLPVDDLDAWVRACTRLMEERAERLTPRQDAREWARRFSWEVCASRHLDVFMQAATKRRQRVAPFN